MIKRWRRCWLHTGLLLLLVALSIQSGCDSSGYKTFTLEEGIGHFTFEYPARYEVELVEERSDLGYTSVTLSGPGPNLKKGGMDYTFFDVFVDETNDYSPDAGVALQHTLALVSEWPDYQFLEQSTVSVAGVEGQQVVYFYDRGVREYPEDPEPEPLPTIMRDVYFDHSGLIWLLAIRSNQAVAEDANVIFEHILETFKILD